MRYQIGQVVPFVAFTGLTDEGEISAFGFHHNPEPRHIVSVKMLTCTEHHQVSYRHHAEDLSDGFIFTDEDGRQWGNQYPYADYGQLSDYGNRLCSLLLKGCSVHKHVEDGIRSFTRRDALTLLDEYYELYVENKNSWVGYEYYQALYAEVWNEVEKVSGKLVEVKEEYLECVDGKVDSTFTFYKHAFKE